MKSEEAAAAASISVWSERPEELRERLMGAVCRLMATRCAQNLPRPKEIWLDGDQWEAVCDYYEKQGLSATSMSCVVQGIWLRPKGDKIAAKQPEPFVARDL